MVSHVGNEIAEFAPKKVISNATFQAFLDKFMHEEDLADIKKTIREQYNCQKAPYNGNYFLCISNLIRDSSFTCSTRQIYDAYSVSSKAYMMQYNFPNSKSAGVRSPSAVHQQRC